MNSYNRGIMTVNRTQQMVFCEDALPMIFHHTPRQFLNYLDRDGNRFLQFYWKQVAKNLADNGEPNAFGLNYLIRKPKIGTTLAMIILPVPQVEGEAYFLGLIYRARRLHPFIRLSSKTNVYALLMAGGQKDNTTTQLIEIFRGGKKFDHGLGPVPGIEGFYQHLIDIIGILDTSKN